MKTFLAKCATGLLWITQTSLICFAVETHEQKVDWSELRGGDTCTVRALLQRGVDVRSRDADGNSALHMAALHANADALKVLLHSGVDPNGTNNAGATPLIYAAGDPQKVRVLLAYKATANQASLLGMTPLISAAGYPESEQSVALLIKAGANISATNNFGYDAVWRASYAGNTAVVKLLLKYGANPNTRPLYPNIQGAIEPASAPLHNAAFRGEPEMIRALLKTGARLNEVEPFGGSALHNALYANHSKAAALLIEQGIDLNLRTTIGDVPTSVWSAYSDVGDTTVARLLLKKNCALDPANETGDTALTWARKRGDNDLVRLFIQHGVPEGKTFKDKKAPQNNVPLTGSLEHRIVTRATIQRSIDALEITSSDFLDSNLAKRNDCVSCHHQTFPALAFGNAGARGFKMDWAAVKKQTDAQIQAWSSHIAAAYEMDEPLADAPISISIGLAGLAASGHKADALTDAMIWYLATNQEKDGSWRCDDFRPPIEDGRIPGAALSICALKLYPIQGREAEFSKRIERAASWLARAEASTQNRLAYKLLGLTWSGSHTAERQRATRLMLAAQRPDGGWAQLLGLESDAWATGQALVALHECGAIKINDPVYQRGVAFLLRTQFDDGSWFVRSRTWPFQPYFDSHFPHGKDQWISAAGTTWAVLALLNTLDLASAASTVALRSH